LVLHYILVFFCVKLVFVKETFFPSYKLSCGLQLSYPKSNTVRKGSYLCLWGSWASSLSRYTIISYSLDVFLLCNWWGSQTCALASDKKIYHQTYIWHLDLLYSPICHLIMLQSLEFLYLCPISKLHNTGLLVFWHCGSTLIQQSRTPSTLLRATLCMH
jgi:hypothetical protein